MNLKTAVIVHKCIFKPSEIVDDYGEIYCSTSASDENLNAIIDLNAVEVTISDTAVSISKTNNYKPFAEEASEKVITSDDETEAFESACSEDLDDNMEMLDSSLQQSDIYVNYKDKEGKTLLAKSVAMNKSNLFIMRLLEAGGDPNVADKDGTTPLHNAVTRPDVSIADELIKRGANVNAQQKDLCTPLHNAIIYNNLDAVCLLLYYGADVRIPCKRNKTPLMYALQYNIGEIVDVLFDFYDNGDFPSESVDGCSALSLAAQHRSRHAVKLVEMGEDVNFVSTSDDENLLVLSLNYKDTTLFKLMWDKFDYQILLGTNRPFVMDFRKCCYSLADWVQGLFNLSDRPFLMCYIKNCCFSSDEWVRCLYLILKSPIAFELVQHYNDYLRCLKHMRRNSVGAFYQELLRAFQKKEVKLEDRTTLIFICLSLTYEANIYDIRAAYELYGFNEELEILIYFVNCNVTEEDSQLKFLLLPFILGLNDDLDGETLKSICRNYDLIYRGNRFFNATQADVLNPCIVRFFSPHSYLKFLNAIPARFICDTDIKKELEVKPRVPLLLDLCKNEFRKFVRRRYNVKTPYHFFDAMKNFNLPPQIENIVLFKVPLY